MTSFRSAGTNDIEENSITFYALTQFEDYQLVVLDAVADLPSGFDDSSLSYAITGLAPWTLYE